MMSNMVINLILVSIGGFFGAISRYWLSGRLSRRFPSSLPYGTLTVNLIGSFLLGWLWGHHADAWIMTLLGTGFMGAFTTFSTFKLESESMLAKGQKGTAGLYMALSYTLGFFLVYLGYIFF